MKKDEELKKGRKKTQWRGGKDLQLTPSTLCDRIKSILATLGGSSRWFVTVSTGITPDGTAHLDKLQSCSEKNQAWKPDKSHTV